MIPRRSSLVIFLGAGLFLSLFADAPLIQGAVVCPTDATLSGVDVSVFQGTIDWAKVKASGVSFAFIRVSDGTFLDTKFGTNYAGAKAAGVIRSAYQYFEPAEDPLVQANLLLQKTGAIEPGDLAPALDVEVTGGQSAAIIVRNIQIWITRIEQATGRVPFIYTGPSFWNTSVGSRSFSSVPLWVANWGVTCPNLPNAWTNWVFWQYSDAGSVSGISNAVDLDRFGGSLDALRLLSGVPSLRIASLGADAVVLAWPADSTNVVLQETSVIGVTHWASLTNAPAVVGNENQVEISPLVANRFYRLAAQ